MHQTAIEKNDNEDTKQLVHEYTPSQEFVTMLLKPEERVSSYCLQVRARPKVDLDRRVDQAGG